VGFMDKMKEAVQDVAAEAKKATATGKTKLDQMQTRKKADEAAKKLGYLIYAERTSGATAGPEADRLVGEISQLEAEIAEAEAQAAAQQAAAQQTAATPPPSPAPGQTGAPAAPQTPPAPAEAPPSDAPPGDFKL
jgi:septal ring factor EnvC (AmiA/AmiB activator)